MAEKVDWVGEELVEEGLVRAGEREEDPMGEDFSVTPGLQLLGHVLPQEVQNENWGKSSPNKIKVKLGQALPHKTIMINWGQELSPKLNASK